MQALNSLVRRAGAGSLRRSKLSPATITVTNHGEQSPEEVFGVIHPPQVDIPEADYATLVSISALVDKLDPHLH